MDSPQKLRDTDAVMQRLQAGERGDHLSLVLVSQTWPVPVSSHQRKQLVDSRHTATLQCWASGWAWEGDL